MKKTIKELMGFGDDHVPLVKVAKRQKNRKIPVNVPLRKGARKSMRAHSTLMRDAIVHFECNPEVVRISDFPMRLEYEVDDRYGVIGTLDHKIVGASEELGFELIENVPGEPTGKGLEVALTDVGIVPTVISTADATKGAAPLVHQRCVVVKIHGDYLDDRIKNTEDELASYDPAMDAYLDRIFDEFGLIVCGWSGEWDQALRTAFERCSSRRYATFWAALGKIGARAEKLLTLRGGHLIEIDGPDKFFLQLQEMVEGLKESKAAHPLSISAQVSAVKKFVASPQHRVRFHDLLIDEANRVRAFLDTTYTAGARPVDTAAIKARFEAYDTSTDGLQHMLFAAAQWAEAYNFESIRQSITKLVPSNRRDGVVLWLEMNKYPGAVCFYAASYGAMAGGNWPLFKYLVEGRLTHRDNEESVLEHLGAIAVVDSDTANALHSQKRYTPISDHFMSLFDKLSKAEDIEREFERLEVLLALHYLAASKTGGRYTLRGRFVWNHHSQSIQRVLQEVERDGDEWPPLKAGLFGGTKVSAVSLIENLVENVKKMANHYW